MIPKSQAKKLKKLSAEIQPREDFSLAKYMGLPIVEFPKLELGRDYLLHVVPDSRQAERWTVGKFNKDGLFAAENSGLFYPAVCREILGPLPEIKR